MKSYLLLLVVYCLGVNYCSAQRAAELEQLSRYVPPKNQKFVLVRETFSLQDTSVVSPNAYYLRAFVEEERENYKVVKTLTTYNFMRFYMDGRMFCSFAYLSKPSRKELEDMSYGKFGRYIIRDGKLKIELYQDNHDGYAYLYAFPVQDGIQFYKSSSRGWLFPINRRTKDDGHYQKFYF